MGAYKAPLLERAIHSETIRATRPEPPPHVSAEVEVARTRVPKWAIGEFFGTFLLVFFGCGSVCAAVATGAQIGVFQVAIVWGIGIAAYEAKNGIRRGAAGSEASAMVFGEYFPNPGGKALNDEARATMTPGRAFTANWSAPPFSSS